jgi:hypothetical protein
MDTFLLATTSRPALWPTQPPIQWVPRTLSPEVKRPGREAYHSPPSSAEVKNARSYTSTPSYVFMAWCLNTGYVFSVCYLVKHRVNLTFTLPFLLISVKSVRHAVARYVDWSAGRVYVCTNNQTLRTLRAAYYGHIASKVITDPFQCFPSYRFL